MTRPDVGRLPDLGMPLALAAECYAKFGWPVLQLVEHGKVPVSARGLLDATTDVNEVRAAWKCRPRANVGVRIPTGLVVVDVDGPAGVEALRSGGPLPRTLTAATARGWHLFYVAPQGAQLRQGAAFLPGVDSRVAGKGYVVAAPSVHETGVIYKWVRRIEPTPLPAWLGNLLRIKPLIPAELVRPIVETVGRDRAERYARAALVGQAAAVAATPVGSRNHRLTAAWMRCTRDADVAAHLSRAEVRQALTHAARAAGLDEREIARTLREQTVAA